MPCESCRITYRLATTNEHLDQIAALWDAVYGAELGWLEQPCSLRDAYHPYSIYIIAYATNEAGDSLEPVGTVRLVAPSPTGLPVEQFIELPAALKSLRPVEIQRFMILPQYRARRVRSGAPFGVSFGIIKACIHLCFMRGYSHYLVDSFVGTPLAQIDTYKLIGFEELGGPFRDSELAAPYDSVALFLDSVRLTSFLHGNNSQLFRYLRSDDDSFELRNE